MMDKAEAINAVIEIEGGYVNDPEDSGGETNFGITLPVARAAGYNGPMREMPREVAFSIYARNYWDSIKADELVQISEAVAFEVYDTGVNCGVKIAARFLQQALNVLNKQGRLYDDVIADGVIGPATLRALNDYLAQRKESVLVKMLNVLQGARYIKLAQRREKDEKFVYGWFEHRVKI